MLKLLVVILSCEKNRHLWSGILSKNMDNLIILCGKRLQTNYTLDGQILYLNCNDGYGGLPEKMVYAYNAIQEIRKFDDVTHIIKIDDHDCTFSADTIKKIESLGDDVIGKNDYVGQWVYPGVIGSAHIGRCEGSYWDKRIYQGENCAFASGGYSYILSRKALGYIKAAYTYGDKSAIRRDHIYEDLMVGLILRRNGIVPKQIFYGILSDDKLYKDITPEGHLSRIRERNTERIRKQREREAAVERMKSARRNASSVLNRFRLGV